MLAYRFDGVRYDCGSKFGYLEATIRLGLKHPEVSKDLRALFNEVSSFLLLSIFVSQVVACCCEDGPVSAHETSCTLAILSSSLIPGICYLRVYVFSWYLFFPFTFMFML